MLLYLILLFTVMPVVELAVLIQVGRKIGLLWTISIVLLTGVAGAVLAKSQGMATVNKINRSLNAGIMPGEEIINGILILSGGILFLTPGFITDIAGFLLLFPFTRRILKIFLRKKFQRMIDKGVVIKHF